MRYVSLVLCTVMKDHRLCHSVGCFDSGETLLYLSLDNDEVFYADFRDGVLVWDNKIPSILHVEYAYKYAKTHQFLCKSAIAKWRPDSTATRDKDPPVVAIYPRDEVTEEEENTLICFINNFFPPSLKVTWTKNDKQVKEQDPFIETLSNSDGTFHVFSYLNFVPKQGDIYSCSVEHEALEDPKTRFWEVEINHASIAPAVFCGLGLTFGLLGVAVGTFYLVKGSCSCTL
uniref:H-2 class II histocompatibility antigen, A-Q alpha chain-like n=1 Tax=Poecilia reticulata TaxID=8081 RepID=A0A3P9N818_POERE